MSGHKTGYDQRKRRSNSAAFFRHLNSKVRQAKDKSLAEERDSKLREHNIRNLSLASLKKSNNRTQRHRRQRNHKHEKQQAEQARLQWLDTVAE